MAIRDRGGAVKDKEFVQNIVNNVRNGLKAAQELGWPESELRQYLDAVRDFRNAIEGDDPWQIARVSMQIGHWKGQRDFIERNMEDILAAEKAINSSRYTIAERNSAVREYWNLIDQGKTSQEAETIVGQQYRRDGKNVSGRTLRNWRKEFE